MKTMLHLSIALMLIAGSAGVIDFVQLLRSGELDKIYSHEEPVKKATVAHKAAIVSPAALVEHVVARVEEIVIDPDDYGRSALVQEEVVFTETEMAVAATAEAPVAKPVEEAIVELPEVKQAEVILASTTADIKDKPIVKDGKKKKKFNLSMYSRAYIPEIELEEAVVNITPEATDSTASALEY